MTGYVPPGWRLAERSDNALAMLATGAYTFGANCVTFIDGSSFNTATGKSCAIPDNDPPYLMVNHNGTVHLMILVNFLMQLCHDMISSYISHMTNSYLNLPDDSHLVRSH